MAQAARLNLRMQKELKLLLTDPPHGATFPHLSPDSNPSSSSSSSLSTIHAQIEGPEGTVYAKGVFDINIQIPERYPFQPPSVTFATPIYHPNIDNGGRICLDILNLPPKGAWQPSLNISAVLTSIGLLLSEPNPDDGLMCEASREYKYNRQAFDQKARSMTEKFAIAGVGGSHLSMETNCNPSTMEVKVTAEPKLDINEHVVNHKKLSGNRRKLSLESTVSGQTVGSEVKVNEVSNPHLFIANSRNQIEVEGRGHESKGTLLDYNSSHENLNRTRQRLSLESFSQPQKRDFNNQKNAEGNHCPSQASASYEKQLHQDSKSTCEERCMSSEEIWKQPLGASDTCGVSSFNHDAPKLTSSKPHFNGSQGDLAAHKGYVTTNMTSKKPCLAGKKLSLGNNGLAKKAKEDDKENAVPIQKLPLPNTQSPSKPGINHEDSHILSHSQSLSTNPSMTLPIQQACRNDENQQRNEDVSGNIKQQVTEESPLSETVIVLDSEDSEEEKNTPVRTKLSLARRRLGKWKAKA